MSLNTWKDAYFDHNSYKNYRLGENEQEGLKNILNDLNKPETNRQWICLDQAIEHNKSLEKRINNLCQRIMSALEKGKTCETDLTGLYTTIEQENNGLELKKNVGNGATLVGAGLAVCAIVGGIGAPLGIAGGVLSLAGSSLANTSKNQLDLDKSEKDLSEIAPPEFDSIYLAHSFTTCLHEKPWFPVISEILDQFSKTDTKKSQLINRFLVVLQKNEKNENFLSSIDKKTHEELVKANHELKSKKETVKSKSLGETFSQMTSGIKNMPIQFASTITQLGGMTKKNE